ncbi:hypothetical protein [Luteolibacter sp. LG18]|uniref:hypothetical protein n=1 Tax=Luteolibacter sp. LG18 TaxID=2819286 RepID=UPI0030C69A36
MQSGAFLLVPIGLAMLVLSWLWLVRPVTGRQGNFSTSFFSVIFADLSRCAELAQEGDAGAKRALRWCQVALGVAILGLGGLFFG